MAEGRKVKSSVSNDIEVYRHETDKRKNALPVGLASYGTSKPKKYEYINNGVITTGSGL